MNHIASKKWIDTHFHVFHADEAVDGARYVPKYTAALSDWQSLAQAVGVTRGVWVQPSFLGEDNSLMLRALRAHPEMLRGVAVIAADTHPDVLKSLHANGVRGLRLNLSGVSHDIPEWTRAERVWHVLYELGWHVEVHTDRGALVHVLAQLPSDIPMVVDHMGKPNEAKSTDATIALLTRRAQHALTYVKLSGAYRLGNVDATSLAQLWLQEVGPQALLWGSDWPCTNHEHLAHYDVLFDAVTTWVGSVHLDTVLGDNPHKLYWTKSELKIAT